jgi:cytochrome c oxidase subunit 2
MARKRAWFALAVLVLTTLVACSTKNSPAITNPKGNEAHTISGIWWLMCGMASVVYLIVGGFIVVAAFRGRRSEEGKPSRVRDSTFIVVGGLIVPSLILLVLGGSVVYAANNLRQPEKDPLRIEVVGKRWWWDVSYPDRTRSISRSAVRSRSGWTPTTSSTASGCRSWAARLT